MTQIQWPSQARPWGAFLPQVTVQVGRTDPLGPSGMKSIGDSGPSFTTVRRTSMGGQSIGQSTAGQAIYQKAKTEVARFDALAQRVLRIANKTVRDQLIQDFGLNDPSNKDKAQYARDAVVSDLSVVEAANPFNYYFYTSPGPQGRRPSTLAAFNSDLESEVHNAEVTYGILPEPVTTTITNTIQSPLTIPILVGAGAVALALLLS